MIFEIHAEKNKDDKKVFYYDNMENILKSEDGVVYEFSDIQTPDFVPYSAFDKDHPLKKSKLVTQLKIQLGLSCNYTCDYCSQKFVERPDTETNFKDIDDFLQKINVLEFSEEKGLRVEFWGGEPLVYWKTLKPLAEALRERFASWKVKPQFSIITNGSILTDDIIDWLMMMDFNVSISHDGPGQHLRGPDPFDDPETKERILGFYRMMTRLKKGFSFNPMLTATNYSRKEIYEWFVKLTGDENVALGEGGLVDAYDEDGVSNSLQTIEEHFQFRRTAFTDLITTNGKIGFMAQVQKMMAFGQDVLAHKKAVYLNQKCGMDSETSIAVDLRGNVITCQNVSAVQVSNNGESHLGGNLDNFDDVAIKTSTHWANRKHCSECPVLHLCKGACMFLEGDYWDKSCANSYSDNIVLFSIVFNRITDGYIPTLIKSDSLPTWRQDIFGTVLKHEEKKVRKTIPIKVISEKAGDIDGIEVYDQARIINIK